MVARTTARCRAAVGQRQVHLHRDQRLQRQQRPGGGRERPSTARTTIYTAGNAGNEAPTLAADRRGHPRRGHADHHRSLRPAGEPSRPPAIAHPDVLWQLQRHPSWAGARRTRLARTTTSAASRSTTTCCTTRRAAAVTASNTVYFLDTTGTACPDGVGLLTREAKLPTASSGSRPPTLFTHSHRHPPPTPRGDLDPGLTLANMCILEGVPDHARSRTSQPRTWTPATTPSVCGSPTRPRCTWRMRAQATTPNANGEATRRRLSSATANLPEVGLQRHRGRVAARLHPAERPQPRQPLHGPRLPDRDQLGHRAAGGAGHRRPAQPDRPGQLRRHRDHLGLHLHRERCRRPGRGSEPAGRGDHRLAEGDQHARQVAGDGSVPSCPLCTTRSCGACRSRRAPARASSAVAHPVRQLHKR